MPAWLHLGTNQDGNLLLDGSDGEHAYLIRPKGNGLYDVVLGQLNADRTAISEQVLYQDLPGREVAVRHAADHEGHVYADDDQVLLQAISDGQVRVVDPYRLPAHLDRYY